MRRVCCSRSSRSRGRPLRSHAAGAHWRTAHRDLENTSGPRRSSHAGARCLGSGRHQGGASMGDGVASTAGTAFAAPPGASIGSSHLVLEAVRSRLLPDGRLLVVACPAVRGDVRSYFGVLLGHLGSVQLHLRQRGCLVAACKRSCAQGDSEREREPECELARRAGQSGSPWQAWSAGRVALAIAESV
jgi:hypothetical protein